MTYYVVYEARTKWLGKRWLGNAVVEGNKRIETEEDYRRIYETMSVQLRHRYGLRKAHSIVIVNWIELPGVSQPGSSE